MTKEEIMVQEGWTEEQYYDYLNAIDEMWYSWEGPSIEEDIMAASLEAELLEKIN